MLSLINNIIDRCLFTLTFIVGVQLPEFIHQYLQRLSGHLEEAKLQLSQFSALAQSHYQGDLVLMVKSYKANSDPVIVDTGKVIEQLVDRVNYLDNHFNTLFNNDYVSQIQYFILNADLQIMQQTAKIFTLAIPLEINALATGAIVAITGLMIKEACYLCTKHVSKKLAKNFR